MARAAPEEAEAWQVYEFTNDRPEAGELEHLAHRILGLKDPTRREVLEALRTRQKSHADLEKELGRNPGLVHRALKALEQDGLVLQRLNARQKPVVRSYRPTPSGGFVLDLFDRFQASAATRPLEIKTETGTYILYSRMALKEGRRQRVYFFAKKGNKVHDARPEPSPPSFRVMVPHASAPVLE